MSPSKFNLKNPVYKIYMLNSSYKTWDSRTMQQITAQQDLQFSDLLHDSGETFTFIPHPWRFLNKVDTNNSAFHHISFNGSFILLRRDYENKTISREGLGSCSGINWLSY